MTQAAQVYEEEVGDVLRSLAMGTLAAEAREELTLPHKIQYGNKPHFGMGMTSGTQIASSAYLASRIATNHTIQNLVMKVDRITVEELAQFLGNDIHDK